MADEAQDRRSVLSEAYDKIASAPEPAASVTPAPIAGDTTPPSGPADGASQPSASARERDEQGRFAKAAKEAAAKKAKDAPASGEAAGAASKAEAKAGAAEPSPSVAPAEAVAEKVEAKPAEVTTKAPQSWKPAAREAWSKAPPEVQAEVVRREREIQQALQHTAEIRRAHEEFQRTAAPYEAMYRSLGMSSTQAFDTLSRTFYVLQSGPPAQKAQVLAQVIKNSSVPIEMLAAALDGQVPQGQPHADPQAIAAQVEQRIRSQLSQQAAQVAARRTGERLAKFAEGHEFYDDVRDRMADILAARGKADASDQELEEVYDLACKVHPEISGVVKQREAAKLAATSTEATRRAQQAASSIKSQPTGTAPTGPQDRRSILERRYDELSR